jgi:DNA-binding MarR family transcriptional regulator
MVDASLKGIEETRECFCLAARKRARELTRRYEAVLRPYGLRATQFSVLAALAQAGPVALSKLADILGLERTTLTRVAGVMERDGRLSIAQGDDERVRILTITAEGKRILAAALPAWRRVQKEMAKGGE